MSSSSEMGQMPSEPNLRAVRTEWVAKLPVELAKAQGEFEPPKRTKTARIPGKEGKAGYEYSYADLADLVAAVQPALTKYGIAWTQDALVEFVGDRLAVTVATRLYLGNEVLEFGPLMLPVGQSTPQGIGSAITYAKRYALSSALGVPSEADDDGQAAGQAGPQATSGARLVTQRQIAAMHAAGSAKGVTHEKLHEWVVQNYGVESVKQLTREQHAHVMDKIAALPDKDSGPEPDAPARSEGASQTPSDAAADHAAGALATPADAESGGTDQQAGEGAPSSAAGVGAPATKAEWAEIEKLVGSRREVVALYQEFFDHPKSVKVSDVTGDQLRLLAAAYAEKQAPEAEGTS